MSLISNLSTYFAASQSELTQMIPILLWIERLVTINKISFA